MREICQPVIGKTLEICQICYTLNKKEFEKYYKTAQNTGKVREICQPEKVQSCFVRRVSCVVAVLCRHCRCCHRLWAALLVQRHKLKTNGAGSDVYYP